MRIAALALIAALAAGPLRAQDWGDLDALLVAALVPPGAHTEVSFWLPDSADPATAQQAIGVAYPVIEAAGGNTGIVVGHFRRDGGGWALAGVVADLYGQNPRDARFSATNVQLTTSMPGPGEPRCCPTLAVHWEIDLGTLQARRLN